MTDVEDQKPSEEEVRRIHEQALQEADTDRCPVCARPYVAHVFDDYPRRYSVPNATDVCITGGDDPGDYEVYFHG